MAECLQTTVDWRSPGSATVSKTTGVRPTARYEKFTGSKFRYRFSFPQADW